MVCDCTTLFTAGLLCASISRILVQAFTIGTPIIIFAWLCTVPLTPSPETHTLDAKLKALGPKP